MGVAVTHITHCACCSFLLRGRTPHTLPLLQCGVPPTGCSPSGTDCYSVGPPRGHRSCQQTCSSVGSSLHGATGPARSLIQHRLPTGSPSPSGASTCSGVGSSPCCRWISAPALTSMGAGHSCLTMGCTTGCRGISALAPGAPPAPPASLTLVSAGLFLSHILTPLSRCSFCCTKTFSPS